MPHIVIEYSQDSFESKDLPGLVNSVFNAVANTSIVNPDNIKVRTYAAEFYQLGLADSGFIHVVCKTHMGKAGTQKQVLSEAVVSALEITAKSCAKHSMVITVEVVEMDTASYAKSLYRL